MLGGEDHLRRMEWRQRIVRWNRRADTVTIPSILGLSLHSVLFLLLLLLLKLLDPDLGPEHHYSDKRLLPP
jgi:hypothetical protein